ncbi:hypothetical protein Barb4_00083 [Bacteroidales bacterium Barb4]|nr:hypothetical protein Barb4_00083 [Bacteroidales bacterium Barb4]
MKAKRGKRIALLISVLLFFTSAILSLTYRKYIYENNIFDFHIADTISSWFCIPCASLFFYGTYNRYSFVQWICFSVIAFIILEFLSKQGLGTSLTFDYYDIIVILISGLITYLIYLLLKRRACFIKSLSRLHFAAKKQ